MPNNKSFSTYFNPEWTDPSINPEWSVWIRPVKGDNRQAMCAACQKIISLSTMGSASIKSHSAGAKHLSNVRSMFTTKPAASFFRSSKDLGANNRSVDVSASKSVTLASNVPTSSSSSIVPRSTLSGYVIGNDVLKKEVIWSLTASSAHLSNRQAEIVAKSFPYIFDDSSIAQKFSVGKDKLGYLVNHGLYPHFQELVFDSMGSADFFAVSYDESLNKIAQKTQMDIHIRYVDKKTGLTQTRYLNSEFLSESKAVDLLNHLKNSLLKTTTLDRILSVAMDGPNVNWKMLSELKLEMESEYPNGPRLMEFGSCALHVVHGALKTGHDAVKWPVASYLTKSYYFFSGFPSRKSQFSKITGSSTFPPKFSSTRWCQNASASKAAQELLPNINKFVEEVKKMPTSKVFTSLKEMLKDPFLSAKLGFFNGISAQLERFLIFYQSDNPLVPFIHDDLFHMLKSLLKRVLKPEIYAKIKTSEDVFKLELDTAGVYINPKDLDLYNSAKSGLRSTNHGKDQKSVLKFKTECLDFLKATIKKILQRSPLKYSLARAMSCLSPEVILQPSLLRLDKCI